MVAAINQIGRRGIRFLVDAVSCVTDLLDMGKSVYLRANDDSYIIRISDIRITRKSKLLQVETVHGWVTVWATERLIDRDGECLYCSPNANEVEKEMSLDALQQFIDSLGILPPEFQVKEVF